MLSFSEHEYGTDSLKYRNPIKLRLDIPKSPSKKLEGLFEI